MSDAVDTQAAKDTVDRVRAAVHAVDGRRCVGRRWRRDPAGHPTSVGPRQQGDHPGRTRRGAADPGAAAAVAAGAGVAGGDRRAVVRSGARDQLAGVPHLLGFEGADTFAAAVRVRLPGCPGHRLQHLPDDPGARGVEGARDPARRADRRRRDRWGDHVGRAGAGRHVRSTGDACRWLPSRRSASRSRWACCWTRSSSARCWSPRSTSTSAGTCGGRASSRRNATRSHRNHKQTQSRTQPYEHLGPQLSEEPPTQPSAAPRTESPRRSLGGRRGDGVTTRWVAVGRRESALAGWELEVRPDGAPDALGGFAVAEGLVDRAAAEFTAAPGSRPRSANRQGPDGGPSGPRTPSVSFLPIVVRRLVPTALLSALLLRRLTPTTLPLLGLADPAAAVPERAAPEAAVPSHPGPAAADLAAAVADPTDRADPAAGAAAAQGTAPGQAARTAAAAGPAGRYGYPAGPGRTDPADRTHPADPAADRTDPAHPAGRRTGDPTGPAAAGPGTARTAAAPWPCDRAVRRRPRLPRRAAQAR